MLTRISFCPVWSIGCVLCLRSATTRTPPRSFASGLFALILFFFWNPPDSLCPLQSCHVWTILLDCLTDQKGFSFAPPRYSHSQLFSEGILSFKDVHDLNDLPFLRLCSCLGYLWILRMFAAENGLPHQLSSSSAWSFLSAPPTAHRLVSRILAFQFAAEVA